MWTDSIGEEVRRARDEYAARFDYGLDAIVRDLREKQKRMRQEGEIISVARRCPEQSSRGAA